MIKTGTKQKLVQRHNGGSNVGREMVPSTERTPNSSSHHPHSDIKSGGNITVYKKDSYKIRIDKIYTTAFGGEQVDSLVLGFTPGGTSSIKSGVFSFFFF